MEDERLPTPDKSQALDYDEAAALAKKPPAEVAKLPATRPATRQIQPAKLLELAIREGAELEKLQALIALQERWEGNEARKAYVAAVAAFKADPPRIVKSKPVRQTSRDPAKTAPSYFHATLDQAVRAVAPKLSAVGLSFNWITKQEGGLVSVTCVLRHELGHSESVELKAGPDTTGGKNAIQAIGSAVAYLERYTLFAILGLAAEDDDGAGTTPPEDPPIAAEQVNELVALLADNGLSEVRYRKLLASKGILAENEALEQIPASRFAECRKIIEDRIRPAAEVQSQEGAANG